jgi:hypothetical protein
MGLLLLFSKLGIGIRTWAATFACCLFPDVAFENDWLRIHRVPHSILKSRIHFPKPWPRSGNFLGTKIS